MTPIWRKRFLIRGILIAVFGMRVVFPLAVVAIFAQINPFLKPYNRPYLPRMNICGLLSIHMAPFRPLAGPL